MAVATVSKGVVAHCCTLLDFQSVLQTVENEAHVNSVGRGPATKVGRSPATSSNPVTLRQRTSVKLSSVQVIGGSALFKHCHRSLGRYQPGDLWQYLNSDLPAVTCTLDSLTQVQHRNMTGFLLVARDPPTFPAGPLPGAQCT